MMNLKGFWKAGLWSNQGTILGFDDGTEENNKNPHQDIWHPS
jgi:hypothetical protein